MLVRRSWAQISSTRPAWGDQAKRTHRTWSLTSVRWLATVSGDYTNGGTARLWDVQNPDSASQFELALDGDRRHAKAHLHHGQAIRTRRGAGKGGGRRADRLYLLARLARCSKCGLRLTSQTSEGRGRKGHETQYFLCPAKRRSVDCPVGGEFAPATDIDAQIAELV